jgi:hypothetical protein
VADADNAKGPDSTRDVRDVAGADGAQSTVSTVIPLAIRRAFAYEVVLVAALIWVV